jgi:cytoskeletal protein CcmA (bactofilin family)
MWKPSASSSSSFVLQRPALAAPIDARQQSAPPRASGAGHHAALSGLPGSTTHFPEGLTLVGDLNAEEDVIIDGVITGAIDMPAHAITIGLNARVDARILARDVTVHGSLMGKVTALEIIDIREKARVSGEIAAPAVALADGARVNGRIETKRVDAAAHVARYRMKGGR